MRRGDLLLAVAGGSLLWGVWQFSSRAAFIVHAVIVFAGWYYFVDGDT